VKLLVITGSCDDDDCSCTLGFCSTSGCGCCTISLCGINGCGCCIVGLFGSLVIVYGNDGKIGVSGCTEDCDISAGIDTPGDSFLCSYNVFKSVNNIINSFSSSSSM